MITAQLGGQPVTIHETRTLDVGAFRLWAARTRLMGLDKEGLAFDHEDMMNHYGPLRSKWLRLVQLADLEMAWNLDPNLKSHRQVLDEVFSNPWHQFTTWGSFDPEAAFTVLGHDITRQYYSGMTLANLLRPGNLESHKLKEWAARYDMPELRAAEEDQDSHWQTLQVPAPRKPVKPRAARKGESSDEFAERLYEWSTTRLLQWQRDVQAHYAKYPRREEDRFTTSGGYKSGWSGWRDIDRDDLRYQTYAGLDAIAARRLWPILVEAVKARGVYKPLAREVALEQAIVRVKLRGTLTDPTYAAERLDATRPRHLAAKASFEELTGIKATSPKRIDWLRDRGFPFNPRAITKSGAPGLSGQHVKDYLAKHAPLAEGEEPQGVSAEVYRALELIKEAGSTQNLTTFLGGLVRMTDPDGRIHPQFNVLGAETGRWTARGPAVQTFSNKNGTRGIIIPEPGHVLASLDQSQIEVRVFAVMCEDPDLIEAFNRGQDIYGTVALKLFGPNWTKRHRSLCKRIILGGCLYAGGNATLQTQLHDLDGLVISQDEIGDTRKDFYAAYPKAKRFIRKMTSPHDVWLPSGRFVPGDEDREYRGTNSLCQGTARDLIVDTTLEAFKLGYEENLRLVVHDEDLFSLPLEGLDTQLEELESCFKVNFRGVQLDCDVELYPVRWGEGMISWKGRGKYATGDQEYGTLSEAIQDEKRAA
jgi:DNA polymerase-1